MFLKKPKEGLIFIASRTQMSDIAKREFLKKKMEIVKRQEFEERLHMHLYQKVYLNYNNFEHI